MTKAYPSNLTWEQWELIADQFPSEKPGGRPRTIALFSVVNAILYVLMPCDVRGEAYQAIFRLGLPFMVIFGGGAKMVLG
jgi:hypothetical protein